MKITYSNGATAEAVLLSRTENTMRLAVEGTADATVVTNIRGLWVTPDCEPVTIEFAWERHGQEPAVCEDDFRCSRELASRLIQSLVTGSVGAAPAETPAKPASLALRAR
jgi:hypothetical protein